MNIVVKSQKVLLFEDDAADNLGVQLFARKLNVSENIQSLFSKNSSDVPQDEHSL
jgi:hypothetical protein